MRLLAIDTATDACSAALYLDGQVREFLEIQPRRHGALILGMMEQLLVDAGLRLTQLDALAFGRGPGAFTGVRIATGVIQGAAFGAGLPVVPVSTLAALAQRHHRLNGAGRVLTAFDARMGEVYWGAFQINAGQIAAPVIPEQVAAPDQVLLPDGDGWEGAGGGWAVHGDQLRQRLGAALGAVDPELACGAQEVAILGVAGFQAGQAVAPDQALPVYLRDRVTWPGSGK